MYTNYIFDVYGTLADIHTNEKKADFWKKLACFLSLKGASYTSGELRTAFRKLLKEENARKLDVLRNTPNLLQTEITHPEPDIAHVFAQLFSRKGVTASKDEISDFAILWRCISLERLGLFDGVPELLQRLKSAGKRLYLLSNAQALFTSPD